MKIVLVRPNYQTNIIVPPLGLGYLASSLKKQGIRAVIVDGLNENLNFENLVQRIVSLKPDAVGITCLTAFYYDVVNLSRALKEKGCRVIIGGVHPTFLPMETLNDSKANFVVCGEGEIALPKLIKKKFKSHIPGVYSKKDLKKGRPLERAEAVENLDDLPIPDWKQLDPRAYTKASHSRTVVKHLPAGTIMTTRGCPYHCSFCASHNFYNGKIRFRSPENVIREIKYLVKHFGVKEIHFEDDNLTLKKDHIEKICHLLIKKNLKINWSCPNGIRADTVDEDLLRLMKRAGCYSLVFGIESANPQILKNIHKQESIETIKKSIDIASKLGIECHGFFIFGLPGETKRTIRETIEFAKNSKLIYAHFMILDVLPGSELWDKLKGQFKPNWRKTSYREPEWWPRGLSKKQLMDAQTKATREFHFRPEIFSKLIKLVRFRQIRFLFQRLTDYRLLRFPGQE